MLGGDTMPHSLPNILDEQASMEILEVSDSEWIYGVGPAFGNLNNENFGADNNV